MLKCNVLQEKKASDEPNYILPQPINSHLSSDKNKNVVTPPTSSTSQTPVASTLETIKKFTTYDLGQMVLRNCRLANQQQTDAAPEDTYNDAISLVGPAWFNKLREYSL